MNNEPANLFHERYYVELAAAFVRGMLPDLPPLPTTDIIQRGLDAGLRLHRFKRTGELPRVRKVLGILHGLQPVDLLDIGSGRGVFLWPFLDAFSNVPVTAIDRDKRRVANIQAVAAGGIDRLNARVMDATRLEMADNAVDVVAMLEVLEHMPKPELAAAEAMRVARRFILASVPSKADSNPEHIRLFSAKSLEALFKNLGARRVGVESVLNHLIAVVTV